MTIKMILVIFAAGILQSYLHYKQWKKLSSCFVNLRKKGNVLVGKKRTIFRGGVILMMMISKDNQVIEAYMMKGYTSFAKIKPFHEVIGKKLSEINKFNNRIIEEAFQNGMSRLNENSEMNQISMSG